jgi:hypothetical protein
MFMLRLSCSDWSTPYSYFGLVPTLRYFPVTTFSNGYVPTPCGHTGLLGCHNSVLSLYICLCFEKKIIFWKVGIA